MEVNLPTSPSAGTTGLPTERRLNCCVTWSALIPTREAQFAGLDKIAGRGMTIDGAFLADLLRLDMPIQARGIRRKVGISQGWLAPEGADGQIDNAPTDRQFFGFWSPHSGVRESDRPRSQGGCFSQRPVPI